MGYWEEKRAYQEELVNKLLPKICDYCGARINAGEKAGMCQSKHWFKEGFICKKCLKVCKECKKIFCPKHIDSHDCVEEVSFTCPHCKNNCILYQDEKKILQKEGQFQSKCPYCKKEVLVE